MKKYENEFIKFALQDDDFKNAYLKIKGDLNGFKSLIEEVAEYCFNDEYFNPYLDKPYLDYCYLKVGDKIINLDDIWEVYNDYLEDMKG